ncbi:hypothetical protein [Rhizobium sp. G21]|uniref:hypothetical protein n=1 Tax=Rhizobium sp. G21 TaxID=2758439 RepID=UPI001600CEC1|nr:hypothetical protein [Rhizobium sp. G21]MBB1248379.1 hypothetical protein [Rhizobium sp. G21]
MESKYQHHGTALYGKRAVAIWLLIGVLPLLVQISGNNFLPSPAWIRDVRDLAMLVGIGTGGFTVWLIVSSVSQSSSNELKKVIAVIASPVLGYCLGATVVNIAVPMVMAIVFGGLSKWPMWSIKRVTPMKNIADRPSPSRARHFRSTASVA